MLMPIDTNLSKLTPEEFAEFYLEALKEELGVYNLQANKVGFLGFLINMLGNVTYDSKVYKDMLFKEAFPATAQQDDKKMWIIIYLTLNIKKFEVIVLTHTKKIKKRKTPTSWVRWGVKFFLESRGILPMGT